jgi:hypothetical protein
MRPLLCEALKQHAYAFLRTNMFCGDGCCSSWGKLIFQCLISVVWYHAGLDYIVWLID